MGAVHSFTFQPHSQGGLPLIFFCFSIWFFRLVDSPQSYTSTYLLPLQSRNTTPRLNESACISTKWLFKQGHKSLGTCYYTRTFFDPDIPSIRSLFRFSRVYRPVLFTFLRSSSWLSRFYIVLLWKLCMIFFSPFRRKRRRLVPKKTMLYGLV